MEHMFCATQDADLVRGVLSSWKFVSRTRSCQRRIMEATIHAETTRSSHERLQAEAQTAERRANDERQKTEDALIQRLFQLRAAFLRHDAFMHWRCVTYGLVLPCRRRKATADGNAHSGVSRKSSVRRKAFLWWLCQIREHVIRRVLVDGWVTGRAAVALQTAWRSWHHVLSAKSRFHDAVHIGMVVRSCTRGFNQVTDYFLILLRQCVVPVISRLSACGLRADFQVLAGHAACKSWGVAI